MQAFMLEQEKVLAQLGVDETKGLTEKQVVENAQKYGVNRFTPQKKQSFFSKILLALKEPMMIILLIAAFITLGVNVVQHFLGGHADFAEVIGIFAAILLAVFITVWMEGRSAKAFEALNKIKEDIFVRVVRGGQVTLVAQSQIVVGDIILLETGNKLPADGRLLKTTNLQVDESALTGESEPADKNADAVFPGEKTPVAERANMVYSGCFVTAGSGKMVVTAVGDATEFGAIARELSKAEVTSTPLQEKLTRLGKTITVLGGIAAGLVFLVQLMRMIVSGDVTFVGVSQAFITSIVLIVASVPEGLPTIVAISLAINMVKMSRENALVKKMVACETVGSVNVICTDKTGTLTQNRMTVCRVYDNGEEVAPTELSEGFLSENICVNSTANIKLSGDQAEFIGNPTECAMLTVYERLYGEEKGYEQCRAEAQVAHQYSFSSETKNMTTVLRREDGFLAYSKGSPEKILAQCDRIMLGGKVCELTPALRAEVEQRVQGFQAQARRVLAMAHREIEGAAPDFENGREALESTMVYDGFMCVSDPLRPDVSAAVGRCRNAGISVKMLTGDNITTACAIADELQLLEEGALAVEAVELEDLSDEKLKRMLPKIRVIARSTPVIKMRVVKLLKEMGDVVAVTGDGINDAPAIKNADVGIAMGISGTEVSKEASDIVLLDDSFSTIVKQVHWGRGIYENFRRFIQFQLTVNVSSVVVVLASVLSGMAAPFSALQMLWINIIMDGPPALTLGLEPARGQLMDRLPVGRDENIVSRPMAARIFVNGIFISGVVLCQNFTNFLGVAVAEQSTVIFAMFVLFQLFNAFNARELDGESIFKHFTANRLMLAVFAAMFALQVFITQFGGSVFKTQPLSVLTWGKVFLAAFSIVVFSELTKVVIRVFHRIRRRFAGKPVG